MVNPEHFELPKEELLARLKWYEKKHGPYIRNRGVHNWKNLFNKPTLQDWLILFMIICALFITWSYSRDITACQEFYNENSCSICFIMAPDGKLFDEKFAYYKSLSYLKKVKNEN